MAHRKEAYDAGGHEITIQQVNEGGKPSAWIDGYAAHGRMAMDYADVDTDGLGAWDALERVLAFMADNDVYFCPKCETFYDYDNAVGTGFAGHKCGDCNRDDKHCPDNPDGNSHDDECLNPSQRHNARVATKYKCEHCGRKRSTTPTG